MDLQHTIFMLDITFPVRYMLTSSNTIKNHVRNVLHVAVHYTVYIRTQKDIAYYVNVRLYVYSSILYYDLLYVQITLHSRKGM